VIPASVFFFAPESGAGDPQPNLEIHLKPIKVLLLAGLCTAASYAASFSTSVAFPSSPTQPGCSKSRTDNLTGVCSATLNASSGTSLISAYRNGGNYIVFAMLQATKPSGSRTTVKASYSATITDYAGLMSGGVHITSDYVDDTELVTVYDDTGSVVAALSGGDSVNIPYNKASSIQVAAMHGPTTSTEDYVSFMHLTFSTY
jgi:hypothetical protein